MEVWPRESGKSSTCQLIAVRVGSTVLPFEIKASGKTEIVNRPRRHFLLYVSGTQKQANTHVQAIAAKFEQMGIGRSVNEYGVSRGWSASLLRTDTNFNVLAIGLDAAARGLKLDDFRPDWIVLDDIDAREDKPEATEKKIRTIAEGIIPAGSEDCAILVVQNRILENGVIGQLCGKNADFLLDREPARIEPAVWDLVYESYERANGFRGYRIVSGAASWPGQSLEKCEANLNSWGRVSFLREAQHDVSENEDGLWQMARDIDPFRAGAGYRFPLPDLDRIVVGVDPPRSTGQCGIVVMGRKGRGEAAHGYVLEDCSPPPGSSTGTWCKAIISAYNRWKADAVCVEINFGGNMVRYSIEQTEGGKSLKIREVNATRGKIVRAEPIQGIAEGGRLHHAGVFVELEKELCNFKQGDESPNRLDAMVWAGTDLMLSHETKTTNAPRSVVIEDTPESYFN